MRAYGRRAVPCYVVVAKDWAGAGIVFGNPLCHDPYLQPLPFWILSILIYLLTEPLNFFMGIILTSAGAFCLLGVWFFIKGYRKGMAVRLMNLLKHIPGAKKWARGFVERHKEQLDTIDSQIAALHNQNRKSFVSAVLLELACRFCSAFEIMFILLVLTADVSFAQCVLIFAFTSLFANLLFSFHCSWEAVREVLLCQLRGWPCRQVQVSLSL